MMSFEQYPEVAADFMNEEHREFITIVNQLEQSLKQGEFVETELAQLIEHVKAHFAHEEQEMLASGFPPYTVHKSEHERVIVLFEQQQGHYLEAKDNQSLLIFLTTEVPAWFEQHLNTMDTVTARFISMH